MSMIPAQLARSFQLTLDPVTSRLQGSRPFWSAMQAYPSASAMWLWSLFGSGTLAPAPYSRFDRLRMTRLQRGSTFKRRWPLASRIISRWEDYITITQTTRSLLFWMFALMLSIHWASCFWALIAQVRLTPLLLHPEGIFCPWPKPLDRSLTDAS